MRRFTINTLFLLIVLLLMAGCQAVSSQFDAVQDEPSVIDVGAAQSGSAVTAAGALQPLAYIDIAATSSGEVIEVFVETGDEVTVDQPLIQLDTTELEAQLALKQADVAKASTKLQEEQNKLNQSIALRDLLGGGDGSSVGSLLGFQSDVSVTDAQDKVNQAQADVDAAQAALALAQLAIDRMTIKSPLAGTVIVLDTQAGATVAPGATVVTVADIEEWILEVMVLEDDVLSLEVGDAAEVRLASSPRRVLFAAVEEIAGRSIEGVSPDPEATEPVNVFPVKLKLVSDGGLALIWGMKATADIGGNIVLPTPTPSGSSG
jgi:HlyD family secretion protein